MEPSAAPAETTADRYRRLTAAFAAAIAAVPDDRWADRSPCEDWTARDVVRHVVDTQGMFLGLVGHPVEPGPSVDDDPLGAFTVARDQVQAGLDDPERAEEAFDGMFGRTTFTTAVDRFLCVDLIVHRWDLARATGTDERIAPADAEAVLDGTRALGDAMRGPGAFGPEIPVPDDATPTDRMLAFLGRHP